MATTPAKPVLSAIPAFLAYAALTVLFDRYAKNVFGRAATRRSADYFKAEKRVAIGALLVYAIMVFALDLRYYLSFLSFGGSLPAFVNIGGLIVFLLLFVIFWGRARKSYEAVFARQYRTSVFILSNLKANLPIVIPWIVLTFCYDLITLVNWPWLQKVMTSSWGDLLFFGTFLIFVLLFFPPLVRRLWGCKKLGAGPLRDHLVDFCRRQNFSAGIYIWPLFEGRVITAGVMGVVPGLRYILITPALLETMDREELDAIMTHEIGHVKRFHLLLYVFLVGGFAVATGFLAEPLFYIFFAKDYFYSFVGATGFAPEVTRNIIIAVPTLLFLLLYFRYIFGYFMRNFERQADLHVFPVLGNSRGIISAFEKIAILSGNIRDQPSWHHFGIGERVDFLQQCERDPSLIKHHHRKVGTGLLLFTTVLVAALFAVQHISFDEDMNAYEEKYIRADLLYDANQEENPGHWLFFAGNFLLEKNYEKRATIAFDLAQELEPQQPDILNNFSWLLLTSKDITLRNPERALSMAKKAAAIKPSGHILDTLATAWWANGFAEEAVKTEKQALFADPEQAEYYRAQIERFKSRSYAEELQNQITGELLLESAGAETEQS